MTHFVGAVVVPKSVGIKLTSTQQSFLDSTWTRIEPNQDLEEFLNKALAPFDENMEYERWVPKTEVIADKRQEIKEYSESRLYQEFLADPEAYATKNANNPDHVKYVRDEFPKRLEWTDEEVYAEVIRWEDESDIRESDGAVRNTYNPKSKWDWWTIGGRWESMYADRQGMPISKYIEELNFRLAALSNPAEVAKAEAAKAAYDAQKAGLWTNSTEAEKKARDDAWEALVACPAYMPWAFPYNLVVPRQVPLVKDNEAQYNADGSPVLTAEYEWIEKGSMGWWGMHNDEFGDQTWIELVVSELSLMNPDDTLVFIDFHI